MSSSCGNVKKVFVPSDTKSEETTPAVKTFAISPKAAAKIKHFLTVESKSLETHGLKVSVVKDGCSGNSYTMDLAEVETSKKNGDKFFTKDGAIVIIEKLSYMFVIGSTLDYKETLLASGFELINPNIKKSCSCGSSFAV